MSKLLPLLNYPYEFIYWHSEDLAIPYSITFAMPQRNKRGYSKKFVQEVMSNDQY